MKQISVALLALLLTQLCSCRLPDGGSNYKRFDYNLQGVWETPESIDGVPSGNPKDSLYARIIISYNSITITGIIAHFEGFTRGIALEAYSEDSLLYIYDRGELQNPIPYKIWEAGASYPKLRMLTLKADSIYKKEETFRRTGEYDIEKTAIE